MLTSLNAAERRARLKELEQWAAKLALEKPTLNMKSRAHFARSGSTKEEKKLFEELVLRRVADEIRRNPM